MPKAEMKLVKVGQIWRDCDKRMPARTITILEITGDKVRADTSAGRRVEILIKRLRPGATGYELIRDVE